MFYLPGLLRHLNGVWLERSVYPLLRDWNRREWVDVIDAHFGFPEGVGCVRAARRLGLPVFVTVRGLEQRYFEDPRIGPQMVSCLRTADGVISVSRFLKNAAVRAGIDDRHIRVIPNAVDTSVFYPGRQTKEKEKLGLPNNRRHIVSVGYFEPVKGQRVLVNAFAQVRRKRRDVRLVFVGDCRADPRYFASVLRLIRERGLEDSVQLAGVVPPNELGTWLRAADAFALASLEEGCCNALLEALACGLPVVATPAGDNQVYVDPPRRGLIVPFNDAEALADALGEVLERRWDQGEVVAGVARRGWGQVAEEVLSFFKETLETR